MKNQESTGSSKSLEDELHELRLRIISLEVENSRLREEARTDMLTGMLRPHAFKEEFARTHALLERGEITALSVVLLDIDHFKSVNDTFGHEVGDVVLARVAEVIRNSTRKGDCAGRLGGEEFAIALPGADADATRVFAERIRAGVEALRLPQLNGRKVTVSAGTATRATGTSTPRVSPEGFLKEADLAMYRAKNSGRNSVMTFAAVTPQP